MSSSLKTLEPKIAAAPAPQSGTPAASGPKPVNPFSLSWRFDRPRGEFVVRAGARAGGLAVAGLALVTGAVLAFILGTAFRAGAGSPAQMASAETAAITTEPTQPQREFQAAAPARPRPQARQSKASRPAKQTRDVATRGTKVSDEGEPKVKGEGQARQAGLNYLILKSYPKQSEASAARELLARKGVAVTVERNLPGWAGKGWYSLVGTTGFDMERQRGAFERHVKELKALKLDPKPYRWRGTEMAAGE